MNKKNQFSAILKISYLHNRQKFSILILSLQRQHKFLFNRSHNVAINLNITLQTLSLAFSTRFFLMMLLSYITRHQIILYHRNLVQLAKDEMYPLPINTRDRSNPENS